MSSIKSYKNYNSGMILITSVPAISIVIGGEGNVIEISNVFSSQYRNYKIFASGGESDTSGAIQIRLGSANTSYYAAYTTVTYSTGAVTASADDNANAWTVAGLARTDSIFVNVDILAPALSEVTWVHGISQTGTTASRTFSGMLNTTDSYTSIKLICPGIISNGVVDVYGYGVV